VSFDLPLGIQPALGVQPALAIDAAVDPSHVAAERARILLDATNAFLGCDDLDAVARAVAAAIHAMFAPDKISVTIVDPDGSLRLSHAVGFGADEQARIHAALDAGEELARRVLGGEALWSDDDDSEAFRERLARYGAGSGFSLAIASPVGIVGTCSGLYRDRRTFDASFRNAARGLAAQAGLTASLISSRDEVRRAADESARRQRTSSAMLKVAGRLALITDPATIPDVLVEAIRAASSAATATDSRRLPDATGFQVNATTGLAADEAALAVGRVLPASAGGAMAELLAGRPAIHRPDPSAPDVAADAGLSIMAPVVTGNEIWGFVGLTGPEKGAGDDDLAELAAGVASIAATAIARADAVSEIDRQRRRSDILLELSSILAEVQDPDRIAGLVCAFIRRASGAPFSMFGRRLPGGEQFRIAATDGLSPDQVARIAAALEHPDRPSLRDLLRGTTTTRTGEAAVGAGMGIGHATGAPIVLDGRTEGFIAIGAPSDEVVRPTDWHELLIAFAALTATAIGRADAVAALAAQRDVLATEVDVRTRSLRMALDELVVASEAKTDFLANVSHELRTPLTAILGFTEVLATGLDGPLNELQQRDLDTIRTSSRHLLELIDDLIDIASIEAGRVQLNVETIDAIGVVAEAVATIRPLADTRDIAVAFETPTGPDGVPVAADRGRLREIVLNLLSNAIKFTPAGGHVVVEVSPPAGEVASPVGGASAVDAGSAGGVPLPGQVANASIAVRDTGPGIAPADHDRIFEKFTRLADPAIPGSGLGLAISRELARLHGGDVTVESGIGAGSRFIVRVPTADRS
jgi:signal transduction histidine kinase